MKNTFAILSVFFLLSPLIIVGEAQAALKAKTAAVSTYTYGPGDYTFTVPGSNRTYQVHVPKAYKTSTAMPLIVALHGGCQSSSRMIALTRLNITSNVQRFIVAYPNGTAKKVGKQTVDSMRFWNPAYGFPAEYLYFNDPNFDNVDDVSYIRAVLDDLQAKFNVETKKVYALGISNGSLLGERLASVMSDRFAAVASLAGPLWGPEEFCTPSRPVPMIYIHGTADNFMPYYGGIPLCPEVVQKDMRSAQESVDVWVYKNQCLTIPRVVYQNKTATCVSYGRADNKAEVEFCTIEGGGHTYPSGAKITFPYKDPGCDTGVISTDLDANQIIWEFFKKYSL